MFDIINTMILNKCACHSGWLYQFTPHDVRKLIISEFINFDANWKHEERQKVINMIPDFINTRVRVDLISISIAYIDALKGKYTYNNEKREIISTLNTEEIMF